MAVYIQTSDPGYQTYMDAIRKELDIGEDELSNGDIDSVLYLQAVESDFQSTLPDLDFISQTEQKKNLIRRYLVLKTIVRLLPKYPPVTQESEFGESVRYSEVDVETRIDFLNSEINNIAAQISPELFEETEFLGLFDVFSLTD